MKVFIQTFLIPLEKKYGCNCNQLDKAIQTHKE